MFHLELCKIPPVMPGITFSEPFYSSVEKALQQRLKELEGETVKNEKTNMLLQAYNDANNILNITRILHRDFTHKIMGFVKKYNFLNKIPIMHPIVITQPYNLYDFHVSEYIGTFQDPATQINNVANRLGIFIQMFNETFSNIDQMPTDQLDIIISGNEHDCFDAQIEERQLTHLIIKAMAGLKENIPAEDFNRISDSLRALAKHINKSNNDLGKKIMAVATNLGEQETFSSVLRDKILLSQPSPSLRKGASRP